MHIYIYIYLLFLVYGLQVLEQSAVRGRKGKGEVMSLEVAFKGGR